MTGARMWLRLMNTARWGFEDMPAWIKSLWHDPVWSKVIAATILGLFALVFTHLGWWSAITPIWSSLWSTSVPLGALLLTALSLALAIVQLYRLRSVQLETLRVVQDVRSSFWGLGSVGHIPAMQVCFDAHVTDISGKPNRILGAEILKPLTHADIVSISNNHDARRPQVLNPHETAELRVSFFVQPVVAVTGKEWRSTVILIDQHGNRHQLKNCLFRSIKSGKPPEPKDPEEHPFSIADPIEKEVVSVLKAELTRYGVCGRICGGLGSVQLIYQGHAFTGVGGDSWSPNSPLNQIIVSDPDAASICSDNLEALMEFYRGLGSDQERQLFVQSLLDRLAANKGYLAVSYFIVAVLWSVGSLPEALEKTKRDLPENETRVFGLSNVLMLLNGLLKYRYPDFTNDMLDTIERMTHGLTEHTFMIPAKIQAIRTRRLLKTPI